MRLLSRYLYAYGPSTPKHFARWLGIPLRSAIELFDEMAAELGRVELDGEPALVLAGDTETPKQRQRGGVCCPTRRVRRRGSAEGVAVPGRRREARALCAGNTLVVLVDGVVGGVWHQRRSGH